MHRLGMVAQSSYLGQSNCRPFRTPASAVQSSNVGFWAAGKLHHRFIKNISVNIVPAPRHACSRAVAELFNNSLLLIFAPGPQPIYGSFRPIFRHGSLIESRSALIAWTN